MAKNIRKLSKEQFGLLLPLIENDDITEINWNGRNLIIKDLRRGPYVSDLVLDQNNFQIILPMWRPCPSIHIIRS